MMVSFIYLVLPEGLHAFAYMASFIFTHFLLSCYMLLILRMARGQPVDLSYLKRRIFPSIRPLLLSSMLISLPAVIGIAFFTSSNVEAISAAGFLIFAIPGIYVLTLYVFTPLLILDMEYDFWDAMEMSRKAVLKSGMENTGVIFALFLINSMATLFAILTLPITMSGVAEIYDEIFG